MHSLLMPWNSKLKMFQEGSYIEQKYTETICFNDGNDTGAYLPQIGSKGQHRRMQQAKLESRDG